MTIALRPGGPPGPPAPRVAGPPSISIKVDLPRPGDCRVTTLLSQRANPALSFPVQGLTRTVCASVDGDGKRPDARAHLAAHQRAHTTAPPAAGTPIFSASFFFVAGATATHDRVAML